MDENLEEIIKIAWRSSSGNTEYYLSRYIIDVTSQLNNIMDVMNDYDSELTSELDDYYDALLQKEKVLQNKLGKLNRLISSLRGS